MSQIVNKFLAQMPTLTIKGNNSGSTANASDLTVAQVNLILPTFTSSLNGLVPFSGGGTTNFLRADGTFAAPAGTAGITALTGDGTATGPGSAVLTLATVNSTTGSFGSSTSIPNFTVNGKGLITLAGSNVVVAPADTLTGTTLASNVVSSSLTSLGVQGQALNMGGFQINAVANPSSAQDAATKSYVDSAISGLTWQGPAQAYAASNVPLTGSTPLVIDGYTVLNGDLVLLGNQTTASQNGEYSVAISGGSYTLTANGLPTVIGDAWLVTNGTLYANSAFTATAVVPAAEFIEFAGPQALSYNPPLSISGNTVSISQAGSSTNGYLSSTDWNTFNNKQSSLTFSDSLVNTSGTVTLVGDTASPSASQYYGTNGSSVLGYYSFPSGGANTALSNLTTTSINQSLLPATTLTYDLGSASEIWSNLYTTNINSGNNSLTAESGDVSTGNSQFVKVNSGNNSGGGNSGQLELQTGTANAGFSGQLTVSSGASTSGTSGEVLIASGNAGNGSGNVVLQTGTAGGTRGIISLIGASINANSSKINNVTDPTSAQDAATKNYVDTHALSFTPNKETFVLSSGDITNQYIDLAHVAKTNSIYFLVAGAGDLLEGASYDYSVSYTGGSGGNTRITFLNDLATGGNSALVASDVVQVNYAY